MNACAHPHSWILIASPITYWICILSQWILQKLLSLLPSSKCLLLVSAGGYNSQPAWWPACRLQPFIRNKTHVSKSMNLMVLQWTLEISFLLSASTSFFPTSIVEDNASSGTLASSEILNKQRCCCVLCDKTLPILPPCLPLLYSHLSILSSDVQGQFVCAPLSTSCFLSAAPQCWLFLMLLDSALNVTSLKRPS